MAMFWVLCDDRSLFFFYLGHNTNLRLFLEKVVWPERMRLAELPLRRHLVMMLYKKILNKNIDFPCNGLNTAVISFFFLFFFLQILYAST